MNHSGKSVLKAVPALLELSHIGKHYGRQVALHDINLHIEAGQRWVVFGKNGAGKTTLLRMLAGLLRPSSGEYWYKGAPAKEQWTHLHREMGFLSHASALYGELSAEENLLFHARLHRLPSPSGRIQSLLERVGLGAEARLPARSYSRGMQQRVAMARLFLHTPSLLILDEPFTGLDAAALNLFREMILEQTDGTLIFTSHDLERGLALAGHMAILHRGELVAMSELSLDEGREARAAYRRWVEGEN